MVRHVLLIYKCFDSDDGKNYEEQGIITIEYVDGNTENFTDNCSSENLLIEYYCGRGDVATEEYSCPVSCGNEACQPILYVEDVNESGNIEIADAQLIVRYLNGLPVQYHVRLDNADVTLDGHYNGRHQEN